MKVAIIGTGGVGGYYGARLAKSGYDVTFIARGEHLEQIKNNGLKVLSPKGDFEVKDVKATNSILEIKNPELIILGVKTWQVVEIAPEISKIVDDNTIVLPLQNGVLASEELCESINTKHVLGGLCRIFSKIESPGIINHMGFEPEIVFGELDNNKTSRVQDVLAMFQSADIKAKIAEDIKAELWKKFIAICVSGLLAITRSTYGEVREFKPTRKMMIALLSEIYALSQKIGIRLKNDLVDKTMSLIDSFDHEATSSLIRDVMENKPSEIEHQNGTVVRLAREYGSPAPVNEFIYDCLSLMELKVRNPK